MNVYTFMEINIDQQIIELRKYFNEKGAEISTERSAKGVEDDLHKIIGVCDATFNNAEVPDQEVESSLNSIVSVLMVMPVSEKTESLIVAFCEKLSKAPQSRNLGSAALRVLNVLFHALPENLGMRYHIYYTMIQVAGQIGKVGDVFKSIEDLKNTLRTAQPPPSTEQVQQLLRLLHQTLLTNNMGEHASKVMLELLGTYTTENASQARDDAHRCIIASLADPSTFIMDHLLTLKPVRFLEGELIHDLLTIFVVEKLQGYQSFYNSHREFVTNLGLDHESNVKKMRFLTFLQLAEESPEMTFSYLEKELQLKPEQVEPFIIEAIKTKLVIARMDQKQGSVKITTAAQRTFGRAQWENLKKTFLKWKTNVALVTNSMQVIATAAAPAT